MKKLTFLFTLVLSLAAALQAQVTVSFDPTSLSFSAAVGAGPQTRTLTVNGPAGQNVFLHTNGTSWLKINGASSIGVQTPATVTVTADPTGLPAQSTPYTAAIGALATTVTVPVTFSIGAVGVSPSSVSFAYQANGAVPNPATLTLTSPSPVNYTAAATTTSGGSWLTVASSGTSPGTASVALNPVAIAGLAPGSYSGTVTITPANGPAIPVTVTLTVTAAPTVTKSADSVNLNYQVGGASGSTNNPSATVTLTNPGVQELPFGVSTNQAWLTATPPSGVIPPNASATITIAYATSANLAQATYSGQVSIAIPSAANQLINIPVGLRIANSPLLNVPNGTLTFTQRVGGAAPGSQTIVATSSAVAADATTGQMALLITKSENSNWLVIPASGQTGSANPITVSVNPAGLAVGTYEATISLIGGGAANNPQTVPVRLTVTNDPLMEVTFGGCSSMNTTCPLNFAIQTGQNSPTTQNVRVATSTGVQASFSAAATMATSAACGTAWLSTGATAAVLGAEATFPITVTPGTIAAGTTCEGTITITGTTPAGAALPNSPVTIPVKMYVSANPMLVPNPIALHFNTTAGVTPASQTITVTSTNSSNIDFTVSSASSGWLFPFTPSARNTTAGSNTVSVLVNPSSLTPGTYSGSITLTATTAGIQNSPVTIPVTVTVSAVSLTVSPATLSFAQALGSAPPAAKTFTVATNGPGVDFGVTTTTQQGANWLSASPTLGTASQAGPATVSVSVNGSNLPAGTYNGTVTVASPAVSGNPQVISVTLQVLSGTLSAAPGNLTFNAPQGGTATAQTIAVSGTPGALSYTVAATTSTGGNWLTATPASGTTNSNVQVSVNTGTLAVGQYTGKVTITSTGAQGSPIEIPVTLNVTQAQTFTAAPATLTFNYIVGATGPTAQTVQLTASSPSATFTAAATTSGGGNWLTVTPASGTGSATLTVGINPASLTTAGTYTGTIAINSPNAAATPAATINVTINVTQVPKPVITSVGNAASYVSGAVAPGENIVIFGTGIGPATLTTATLANNAFPTTVGQTQVFFDNIAAPIIYARADQTSVMVPYGVAGRTTTNIRIVYSGVQSDPIPYNVVAAAPGIYTANASGSGQGAILNQNFSVNGANNAAAKGSVIALYVTGEGVTSPGGVDGRIAPGDGTGLFKPLLPVTATIGGQAATVEYYGTAPGIVYGVMQVNLRIPANAASGNLPVVVTVGANNTQPGVTVAVQ